MRWLRQLLLIVCGLRICSAKCYSFMGLSTCEEIAEVDTRFPFSLAWYSVNLRPRMNEIREAKKVLERLPIWQLTHLFPFLKRGSDLLDNGSVDSVIEQTIRYFEAKGEVVELLYDVDVTYWDLFLSMRAHSKELLALMDTMLEEGAFDKPTHLFLTKKRKKIHNAVQLFSMFPIQLFMPYIELMDRKELSENNVHIDVKNEDMLIASLKLMKVAGKVFE